MSNPQIATDDDLKRVVEWLQKCITRDARGDDTDSLDNHPSTVFWLGRLAPEDKVLASDLGDMGERLEPCAIGMRVRPTGKGPWTFQARLTFATWDRPGRGSPWTKRGPAQLELDVEISQGQAKLRLHESVIQESVRALMHRRDISAALDVTWESRDGSDEVVIELVNTSQYNKSAQVDTNLYECSLELVGLDTDGFVLESLPDAFRYDRMLPAIGLNCAVQRFAETNLGTTDIPTFDQARPQFIPDGFDVELLSFRALADDPVPSAAELVRSHAAWGDKHWSPKRLEERAQAENWSAEMIAAAERGRELFNRENARLSQGASLLASNSELKRAFCLMNEAMAKTSNGRYQGWRAFQLGFLIANLHGLENREGDSDVADVIWFATGGGKTETYLGLLIVAMLRDRMKGKAAGITAWSRFPLRMLSLQQTQRFADAIAAAELVRRTAGLGGEPFSLGFFVGQGATPNAIKVDPKEGEPDPHDETMPARYLVIDRCPFCRKRSVEMKFNFATWRLQHHCNNSDCSWPEDGLPFYVVDEEIYRFLPTVVVGTLDKAASVSMQAAMRGFVGPPLGICSKLGHGFTYAPRSSKPNGCLVPGCKHPVQPLSGDPRSYAPSFRLQDELHLLRDSLGAVDAHYESLYDHLSEVLSGRKPKILGSSATLAGYEKQVATLYCRKSRLFPEPGPEAGVGYWSSASTECMRRFISLAPRGATLEHAVDRILTVLQRCIRNLVSEPVSTAEEIGVSVDVVDTVVSLYGTNVVYGNTLRDLDAISRSAETQVLVDGAIVQRSLTGRTEFSEVRKTLEDLETPPKEYDERVHIVIASSMMSHGVDIDRLNVMVMVGLPLGTAEFIQATARVGRRHPGLVIVIPKMGRERDAGVFRTFPKFVEHADRFVEPVPITRSSRRVLQRTLPGLELARVLMIHEPKSGKALTLPRELRKYWQSSGFDPETESQQLIDALDLVGPLDERMQADVRHWIDAFERNVTNPPADVRFVSEATPGPSPMRSLRDVEEQVPVYGREED